MAPTLKMSHIILPGDWNANVGENAHVAKCRGSGWTLNPKLSG